MRTIPILLVSAAFALTGCSAMKRDLGLGSKVAVIPQSLLASTPCLTRETEAVFGVVPIVVENTDRWHIRLTVVLSGAGGKPPEIRYVLRAIDGSTTRASYEVIGASGLEQQAFEPIARCAGVRPSRS